LSDRWIGFVRDFGHHLQERGKRKEEMEERLSIR
jgi:hypothetical protein